MQHIKKPAAQKLLAILMAAIMFLCAGFSEYAADGDEQGKAHSLIVGTQDVLSALALGALTAEETAEYVVEVPAAVVTGESAQPALPEDPAIGQEDEKPYDGTSAQPAKEDVLQQSTQDEGESSESSDKSSDEPSQPTSSDNSQPESSETSQPVSSETSQPVSSEMPEPETPKQGAPAQVFRYQLDKAIIAALERVKLPFGSNLMKAQLAQGLVGQRLVRFFGSGEIDGTDCQAIVVIDPASEQVKVVAVNPGESGTQSLLLNIVDENGQPLRVNDALQNGMTADKKVLDGTVDDADLPDNALIEVLEINYAQSAQSSTPTDTSSAQEEASSEPAAVTPSLEESSVVLSTFVPKAMSTGQTEPESQDASSQEQTSSEETSSQVTSSGETSSEATSSEQATPSSNVPGGSSEPSEDTPSSEPSPDPIEQEVQTTILLLSTTSEKLEFSAFAAVPIEVGTGFSATAATVLVRNGQITVTKQIKDNWAPHGDPIFVYTLEKLGSDNEYHEVSSDFIRFTGGSSGVGKWVSSGNTAGIEEKSVVFDRLGAGTYRLTELGTIRYRTARVTASGNGRVRGNSVVFTITKNTRKGSATFVNNKLINSWFSHTDVVKNSFTPDFTKEQ